MNRFVPAVLLASLVIVAILVGWLVALSPSGPGQDAPRIRVACAAGVKRPVEQAARDYEAAYGVSVELLYGGSATLLGGLEIKPDSADLYIAADSSYIEDGRSKGLLREAIPLATLTPVIAVPSGNPRSISDLDDLVEGDGLRIGLANPEAAAVGRAARSVFVDLGSWDRFESQVTVFKPTVVDIANDVAMGSLDGAIIWDATAAQYDAIDAIADEDLADARRTIEVAVVESATAPTEALRFARYLAARDRGQLLFEENGYASGGGDAWADRPSLVLYAGSMFNQAIEETVIAFAEREGVDVERVYNGCGILTGQMKAGGRPDAYLSCDRRFLEEVEDRFLPGRTISENPMVLITPRGNPAGISGLDDLTRSGARIGLAHPDKSALGSLTRQLLVQRELIDPVIESGNWVQQAPQGDFLVNAMRAGSLDAAIVYTSNAAMSREELEIIPIDTGALLATQPWAIAKTSDHRHTLGRLHDALVDEDSEARFKALGFNWLADDSDEASGSDES